jgi:hypothetical protein
MEEIYYIADFKEGGICPVVKALCSDLYFVARGEDSFIKYYKHGLFSLDWLRTISNFKEDYITVSKEEHELLTERFHEIPEIITLKKKILVSKLTR